jgi:DNA-binding MarR family transcriptional regulator
MDKKAAPPAHDLADAVAAELRSVVSKLKRSLRAQSNQGDLTSTQTAVLLRLEREGPAAVSDLARAEGIRAQSMGAAIAPLEAAALVSGTPDPEDGRRTLLSLTPSCRAWMEAGRSARQDWLSRALRARLTAREQQELAAAVRLLHRLVDD